VDLYAELALPGPRGGTPDRRAGSVRRTATTDMVWPDGYAGGLVLEGRARDLYTPAVGEPVVLDAAVTRVAIGDARTITAIAAVPTRDGIEGLVGAQGGTYLRGAIDDVLPGEREAATALHLLLDDVAGCSLIAGFVWSRFDPDFRERMRANTPNFGTRKGRVICSGLRPGGFAQVTRLDPAYEGPMCAVMPVVPLATDDPWAWHELPEPAEVCMRRHRRLDVRRDGDHLVVDEQFRDSVWEPDGSEIVLHEYEVAARIDAATGTLAAVTASPRVLPFPECPSAAPNAARLVGTPVRAFRTDVQQSLTELDCCTHLNDMLRCLAEVPVLATHLPPPA